MDADHLRSADFSQELPYGDEHNDVSQENQPHLDPERGDPRDVMIGVPRTARRVGGGIASRLRCGVVRRR